MCNGQICEKATQKVKIGDSEFWVRPPCWPRDIDDVIKEIKIQRAFGPGPAGPICERCGDKVATYRLPEDSAEFKQGETESYDRRCGRCK